MINQGNQGMATGEELSLIVFFVFFCLLVVGLLASPADLRGTIEQNKATS